MTSDRSCIKQPAHWLQKNSLISLKLALATERSLLKVMALDTWILYAGTVLIQVQQGRLTLRPQMQSVYRIAHSQEVHLSGMAAQFQERPSATPREKGRCCHRSLPGKQAIAGGRCSWGGMSCASSSAVANQDQILARKKSKEKLHHKAS